MYVTALRGLKLWWSMCLFEALRFRVFPLEIVASLASRIIEASLYILFWLLISTFASKGEIDPKDIISYYLIANGITPFFFLGLGIASETHKLIKRGELSHILIRPINPIFYPWAIRMGRNMVNLSFGIVQIVIGITIAGGFSVASLPFLLPTIVSALLLNLAFNIIVGAIGFYVVEGRGVKNMALHLLRLTRGEIMPLFLMPVGVATFLQFTPFPASQYHVAIVLQGTRLPEWYFVVIGFMWSVLLMIFAIGFWRYALRRYEAVGQ